MIPAHAPGHASIARATSGSGVRESTPMGRGARAYAGAGSAAARSTARSPNTRSDRRAMPLAALAPHGKRIDDVMRRNTRPACDLRDPGSTDARQLLAQLPELPARLRIVCLGVRPAGPHL